MLPKITNFRWWRVRNLQFFLFVIPNLPKKKPPQWFFSHEIRFFVEGRLQKAWLQKCAWHHVSWLHVSLWMRYTIESNMDTQHGHHVSIEFKGHTFSKSSFLVSMLNFQVGGCIWGQNAYYFHVKGDGHQAYFIGVYRAPL